MEVIGKIFRAQGKHGSVHTPQTAIIVCGVLVEPGCPCHILLAWTALYAETIVRIVGLDLCQLNLPVLGEDRVHLVHYKDRRFFHKLDIP